MKFSAFSFIRNLSSLKLRDRGFTLIELLVVIAILGVLAGAVLVAVNPLEQLARGRDAGRRTTIQQLGAAVQAYYTNQGGTYPAQGAMWLTTGTQGGTTGLQSSGELKISPQNPTNPGYIPGCGTPGVDQNGFCYMNAGEDAIVYARAESKSSKTTAACTGNEVAWIVWSSSEGKTGLKCSTGDPTIPVTGLK